MYEIGTVTFIVEMIETGQKIVEIWNLFKNFILFSEFISTLEEIGFFDWKFLNWFSKRVHY